jgi:hypothetical protein
MMPADLAFPALVGKLRRLWIFASGSMLMKFSIGSFAKANNMFGFDVRAPRIALGLALTFALMGVALAQVELSEDDSALPNSTEEVQIEVLVFRFLGKGAGAELKAGQAPASSQGQALSVGGMEHYTIVSTSERQIAGAYARLQASSDVKPILFTAWKQNLSDQRWVSLKSDEGSERLSGRLLLSNGKPLGLKLELQLDNALLMESSTPVSFRMRADRPAHFDETLYFDHPALGALVRINLSKGQ